MIALFIDESGSFECNDNNTLSTCGKKTEEIIGGIICLDLKDEQGLQFINKVIKEEFINIYGVDYFNKIHGRERVGNLQKKMLERVFNDKDGYGKVVPFYIEKGVLTKNINSNITDDNTASMLYFNMLNKLLTNVILYCKDFINTNSCREIQIYLATREAPVKALSEKAVKEFKSLAISMDETGQRSFKLKSSTSALINISDELNSVEYIKNKINITIREHTINYKSIDRGFNEIFQLTDLICNSVYFDLVKFNKVYEFAYDDINESYRRLFRYYQERRLFDFLQERYNYETSFSNNKYKEKYDSYLGELDMTELVETKSLNECISRLGIIVHEKQYTVKWIKYYIDALKGFVDKLPYKYMDLKLEFFHTKLSVYNHLGDYESNQRTYKKLIELADRVSSVESISLKMKLNKLYAVTCSNEFNFQKALDIIDELIIVQESMKKFISDCNELLFERKLDDKDMLSVEIGKLYSSKGQYLSFLGMQEADQVFREALEYLKGSQNNWNQTCSYFIHFLSDSKSPINEEDYDLINEYLGFDNFKDGIKYFIDLKDNLFINIGEAFKLYAFIKFYIKRRSSSVDKSLLMQLIKVIRNRGCKRLEHPWELILYNIGMFYRSHREIFKSLVGEANQICSDKEAETTLKILGLMIKVNREQSRNSIKDFVQFIENESGSEYMLSYFQINVLKNNSISVEEKVDIINSKFTYMYS